MEQEELKRFYQVFLDCWRFFKEFSKSPSDSDAYWQRLTDAANIIDEKHKNQLCRDFLIVIIGEIDFRSRHPGQPRPIGQPFPGK